MRVPVSLISCFCTLSLAFSDTPGEMRFDLPITLEAVILLPDELRVLLPYEIETEMEHPHFLYLDQRDPPVIRLTDYTKILFKRQNVAWIGDSAKSKTIPYSEVKRNDENYEKRIRWIARRIRYEDKAFQLRSFHTAKFKHASADTHYHLWVHAWVCQNMPACSMICAAALAPMNWNQHGFEKIVRWAEQYFLELQVKLDISSRLYLMS
jgi:hypothetical protein